MNKIEHKMDDLRQKALKILEEKGVQDRSLFRAGMEELIQEVSIYQIELEHQNDELRKTRADLEASRDRLYDLYHNAPAGYATIREDYIIEEINRTACTMLGSGHSRPLIGTRFTRFVHPKDQDGFYFHLQESIKQETPVQCEIDLVPTDDGTPVTVRMESIREAGDGGESRRIRSSIIDITELKRLQKESVRARNLESLGTLAGNLAHEFNNLFMVVFGNISFAKMELEEDHPAARPLEAAGDAIEDARELTGRLMTFSDGGAPVIRLVEPVSTVKEALSKVPGCDGLYFEFHTEGKIRHVYADPDQLGRAVFNIAANARDAMEGSGILWVGFENVSGRDSRGDLVPSGEYVKIVFEDHGPGIPAGQREKVFDPFFTTREGSLGLGLTTAHSIISRHKGILDTTRDLCKGTGAGLVVYFPAYSRHSEEPAGESGPADAGCRKDGILKILVMDDDDAVTRISRKMLEKRGCRVATASDGEEAVELCRNAKEAGNGFDAVILDLIVREGMGGKEAVRHITDVDPDTFVILASGYSSDPVMSNFQRYGFDAALEKPYRMTDLEKVLSKITSAW